MPISSSISALIGSTLALITRRDTPIQRFKMRRLMPWVLALAGWPLLVMLMPLQPFLIQLVGLRGQIFFVPFILVGAMLDANEMRKIAIGIAGPEPDRTAVRDGRDPVRRDAFLSDECGRSDHLQQYGCRGDRPDRRCFRIPATFVQAASYGGVMALTLPLLLGTMVQESRRGWRRNLLLIAVGVSALGVFLSASRSHATLLFVLGIAATLSGRAKNFPWFGWIALLAVVAILVAVSPRMQRFVTLENTRLHEERVSRAA